MSNSLEHLFVLMLENRGFDHMLGFSGIRGEDAENGGSTQINGLSGSEDNSFNGSAYRVMRGADIVAPSDPGHEFNNVLEQTCGPGAAYQAGRAYPTINNTGFVASYVASCGSADPGGVMRCFVPEQLPVLVALAQEFAVCDNWHASMPGPTWPNRMFVHAASSGGLDHSPSTEEIVAWETIGGFQFKAGSIFDALKKKGVPFRLYAGDDFPMVAALKGISLFDARHYSNLASDLGQPSYPYSYVFIEPSYDVLNDYKNSTSQHPLTDITLGEGLIKETYEAIRNSRYWNNSVLIVTWDEHGGFYDHAIPPGAVAPGDTMPQDKHNQSGFTFEQYGPRVPAVIVSPLVPKNLIDHRLYDHASIAATLEARFGVTPLTERDAKANGVAALLSLSAPRTDTPASLPSPASVRAKSAVMKANVPDLSATVAARPDDTVDQGTLPVIVHSALRQDLEMSPKQKAAILERVRSIKTREQARQYLAEVQTKVRQCRVAAEMNPGPRGGIGA
jgi:phospholipase C